MSLEMGPDLRRREESASTTQVMSSGFREVSFSGVPNDSSCEGTRFGGGMLLKGNAWEDVSEPSLGRVAGRRRTGDGGLS
jgi:hypothetical protein